MSPNHDARNIRSAGILAFGLGLALFSITTVTTILVLYRQGISSHGNLLRSVAAIGLAFIIAFVLLGCGAQLQQVRDGIIGFERENLRLTWTALVIVMTLGGAASYWLIPPVTLITGTLLIALIAIRGAVIRLTS